MCAKKTFGHGLDMTEKCLGHVQNDVQNNVQNKVNENKVVSEALDMVRTWFGHAEAKLGDVWTFPLSLDRGCPCPKALTTRSPDYSDLKEKEFVSVLAEISSLAELSGLANRRRVLQNVSLAKWSPLQIKLIKQRKYELENEDDA